MVRLAIIGHGERAARHWAALERQSDVEVAAVVGPESNAALQELFARADVDAIVIAVPQESAAHIAIAAAQAGKRLITEYAPGRSRYEALRVDEAIRNHGGSPNLLMPERHQSLTRELKATLEAGTLGALRYVHSGWIWHGHADEAEQTRSGEPDEMAAEFVVEYATPALDMVAWLFGDVPVATVFARTCSLAEDNFSRYVSTVMTFADASQAIVEVGVNRSFPADAGLQRLALTGMRGSAYFNERDHDVLIGQGGVCPLKEDPVDALVRAYSTLFEGGSDVVNCTGLGIAAAESVQTGQPVEVRQ